MGEREQEEQFMNMGVREALDSGRVGFDEISQEAMGELFDNAPKDQTFVVPDSRYVTVYSDHAKSVGRKDIKFEVEEEK